MVKECEDRLTVSYNRNGIMASSILVIINIIMVMPIIGPFNINIDIIIIDVYNWNYSISLSDPYFVHNSMAIIPKLKTNLNFIIAGYQQIFCQTSSPLFVRLPLCCRFVCHVIHTNMLQFKSIIIIIIVNFIKNIDHQP